MLIDNLWTYEEVEMSVVFYNWLTELKTYVKPSPNLHLWTTV